jgi:general secretion pathway protein A
MYEGYFGFSRAPFELGPDPFFLFETPVHREAFACVYYGLTRRKGFAVLTGEVGTGKTLLTRMLLNVAAKTNIATAYVFNPKLSSEDFLRYILEEFGIVVRTTKSEMLHDLNRFLIEKHRSGSTAALIIDEAHLLDFDVLEEIRLLTNLETSVDKLLQIVLIGQPELDGMLDSPRLRQLKQRIAVRSTLKPLSPEQTRIYIHHRIMRAGTTLSPDVIFPDASINLVQRYSGGIPRLINNICQNGLLSAFAKQQRAVTPDLVEEVVADLKLDLDAFNSTSSSISETATTLSVRTFRS